MKQLFVIALLCFAGISIAQNQEKKEAKLVDSVKVVQLDEIIVKGNPLNAISHAVITIDETKKNSQPRTATDLFKDIPGFSIQKRSAIAAEPSLRAFKYEQMNIKYDAGGKYVHACPNRMDPITAHIIPEEVSKIEVIKGPFTTRFGQTFGGIVNIVTTPKIATENGFYGEIQSGFETNGNNSASRAELQYVKNKFNLTVNGEYREYGNYKDGNGIETPSGFVTKSYSAKAGYNLTENQTVRLDWRQKFGDQIIHTGLPMDSPYDDSYSLGLDYKWKSVSDKIKNISLKSYYTFVDHLMTNGFDLDNPRPNFPATDARTPVTSTSYGGRFEIEHQPTTQLNIFYGLDLDHIFREGKKSVTANVNPNTGEPFETPTTTVAEVWQDATIDDFGFFTEFNYSFSDYFAATAGARLDYVTAKIESPDAGFLAIYGTVSDKTDVTFAGHVGLKFNKKGWNSQLSFGRGVRTASMLERYIYRFEISSDSRQYIGNPDLKPEVNYQTEWSISKKMKQFNIGASAFFSYMDNYITGVLRPSLTGGTSCGGTAPIAPKQFINVNAYQYGFEAFADWKILESLSFNSNISYTKARNLSLKEPLAQVFPMAIRNELKFEKPKYWLSLRSEIVANQNDFAPSFAETATSGYEVFDLRIGYKPLKNVTFGGAILNILDEGYYSHLNFSFKNADINNGYRIHEPGRNFSVFAKYNF
ncbi:MAG TPA: TonB-dependent receptor [Flavobacterium lutivivi]|nr:TonB-dependent receptor [Flavobacterium lutivivi]